MKKIILTTGATLFLVGFCLAVFTVSGGAYWLSQYKPLWPEEENLIATVTIYPSAGEVRVTSSTQNALEALLTRQPDQTEGISDEILLPAGAEKLYIEVRRVGFTEQWRALGFTELYRVINISPGLSKVEQSTDYLWQFFHYNQDKLSSMVQYTDVLSGSIPLTESAQTTWQIQLQDDQLIIKSLSSHGD